MSKYMAQADAEGAMTPQTLIELYNDDNDGTISESAMTVNIDRAECEVDSRLLGYKSYPIDNQYDRLLKHAALTFFMAFSYERHPEYVRQFGDDGRANGMYERGEKLMERIQAGLQKLPDQGVSGPPQTPAATTSNNFQPIQVP